MVKLAVYGKTNVSKKLMMELDAEEVAFVERFGGSAKWTREVVELNERRALMFICGQQGMRLHERKGRRVWEWGFMGRSVALPHQMAITHAESQLDEAGRVLIVYLPEHFDVPNERYTRKQQKAKAANRSVALARKLNDDDAAATQKLTLVTDPAGGAGVTHGGVEMKNFARLLHKVNEVARRMKWQLAIEDGELVAYVRVRLTGVRGE